MRTLKTFIAANSSILAETIQILLQANARTLDVRATLWGEEALKIAGVDLYDLAVIMEKHEDGTQGGNVAKLVRGRSDDTRIIFLSEVQGPGGDTRSAHPVLTSDRKMILMAVPFTAESFREALRLLGF